MTEYFTGDYQMITLTGNVQEKHKLMREELLMILPDNEEEIEFYVDGFKTFQGGFPTAKLLLQQMHIES